MNLCGLRRENENKEDFFFHLLPRAFASLRSLAHPRDKPENPRGLPIRKSRGYSSPYSNRSVNCSFWSHKGRTGRKAVFFLPIQISLSVMFSEILTKKTRPLQCCFEDSEQSRHHRLCNLNYP